MLTRMQCLHDRLFLIGQHTPKHIHVFQYLCQFRNVGRQFTRVHESWFMDASQMHFSCDRADGYRIVAGDDAATHTLFTEPCKRFFGIGANMFGTAHQCDRARCRIEFWIGFVIIGRCTVDSRDQQHTVAVVGEIIDLLEYVGMVAIDLGKNDFRRTHRPYCVAVIDRTPLARRRERYSCLDSAVRKSLFP